MVNPILTPKKDQIYVPGEGVVKRADFTQDHAKTLLARAKKYGVSQKDFIAQHFTVSVGDLPLFEDEADSAAGEQAKKDVEAKAKADADEAAAVAEKLKLEADELAKLEAEIAAEEQAKKKSTEV